MRGKGKPEARRKENGELRRTGAEEETGRLGYGLVGPATWKLWALPRVGTFERFDKR